MKPHEAVNACTYGFGNAGGTPTLTVGGIGPTDGTPIDTGGVGIEGDVGW